MRVVLLHCMSPLLAQSRHWLLHCTCPLLGVKRTWSLRGANLNRYVADPELGEGNEAAGVHHACWRFGCVAAHGARTTADHAGHWVSPWRSGRRDKWPLGRAVSRWTCRARIRRGSQSNDRIPLGGGSL